MPVLTSSGYVAPLLLRNGHAQTVFAATLRPVPRLDYERERIPTPDGDFLDLDWSRIGSNRLALVLHGLEGHSRRRYVLGMILALNRAGWDCLAMNCRSCSGEMNRAPRLYHSGETDDLHTVLSHGLAKGGYRAAALVGFSMGGNQLLKYLGEAPERVPPEVAGAVAFSVPCDLEGSAMVLERPPNRLYMARFLRTLKAKVIEKARDYPDVFDTRGLDRMRTFREFDDRFTAPIHGFDGAVDYWRRCSSRQFLPGIKIPALVVNGLDDPFLSPSCFPYGEARDNPRLVLETPRRGGHCGFVARGGAYWSETRAAEFLAGLQCS